MWQRLPQIRASSDFQTSPLIGPPDGTLLFPQASAVSPLCRRPPALPGQVCTLGARNSVTRLIGSFLGNMSLPSGSGAICSRSRCHGWPVPIKADRSGKQAAGEEARVHATARPRGNENTPLHSPWQERRRACSGARAVETATDAALKDTLGL